ncbi:MAG TPA: class I SAM-dependent methyltransferase [Thermoanaerobaculia bacterium]|nr:class I SAM-dependent methyltransferase [Thermoanaerobaculia bacterium]
MTTTTNASKQSANWDRVAASMPDFSTAPSTAYYRNREIALIERAVGPLAGKKVLKLDLWNEAINTRILGWMSEEGADAVGLDLSHVVVRRARQNAAREHFGIEILNADMRHMPFRDETFDVVYTMGTLEHIAEYRHTMREIHRVMKRGGVAVIGVPNFWDPFLRPLLVAVLEMLDRYPYAPEKSFTRAELKRDVEAAGLEVRAMTGILALPGVLRMLDLFLHVRKGLSPRWTEWFIKPFDRAEARFGWLDRIGYLVTAIATKPS